jgi:hypothetical protein
MVKYGMWVSAVVAVAVLASPARPADDEQMIAESGALEIVLLRQPAVQKELKLADTDTKKLHDFASGQWKKAREIHKLPAKDQDAKYDALTKENETFLSELLSKPQRMRLDQIAMQVAGLMWAGRPDVATALKLTDEQKKALHDLHKQAHKEMQAIHSETKSLDVKHEELKKLHETNTKRLLGLLTADQKAKWKELAGAEFTGELQFEAKK